MDAVALQQIQVVQPDGTQETVNCSLSLLCGLVIVRNVSSFHELQEMLKSPIHSFEIERATLVVQFATANPSPFPLSPSLDMNRLMRDGKYALQVQEVISAGSQEDIGRLIHTVFKGHVFALSLNAVGCRVVQKLLDMANPKDALALVHPELNLRVIDCSLDVNGNHVIQKFIDRLPSEDCQFIVDALFGAQDGVAIRRLASHCYGCRVVQRLISRCTSDQVEPILEALTSDPTLIASLSEDVFGNYVMQHALDHGREIDKERISICLASMNVVELGCSKFASNVLEKAVRTGGAFSTRLLIDAMLSASDFATGEPGILTLMKDRYGNYVVRAVMELTRPEFQPEVTLVRNLILTNAQQLKKYTFSWHLVERLDKLNPTRDDKLRRNHGM